MRTTMFGALVGILLAMTWAIVDFGAMLGVALAGLVGYVAVKVAEGDIDVTEYLNRNRARDRR
jgi:hypothetical protein